MYKIRNTETGNGMWGSGKWEGMLYSGECRKTFLGMSPNIPRNVAKHSRECCQTFWGMSSNILGSFAKHSGECSQKKNNLGHVVKHPVERMKAFR